MQHHVHAALALATALTTVPLATAHASAAEPITCGTVVTSDVTLTADLIGCDEYGLVVGADGVTIDLGGHRIVGTGPFTNRSGIWIDSYRDVTVRDGSIAGFSLGVDAYAAHGSRFTGLDVTGTIHGIDVNESDAVEIADVLATGNRTGASVLRSGGVVVRDSTFRENDTSGVDLRDAPGASVVGSTFASNGFDGLDVRSAPGSTITGNVFRRNGLDGLRMIASDGGLIAGNRATANDASGIDADGWGTEFRDNRANGNAEDGIRTGDGAIDGGGNRANGNGGAECAVLACG